MDSTNFESNNNRNKGTVSDESYEDDFEKELDSYSEESSTKKSSPFKASSATDEDTIAPPPIRVSSPTEVEKGQQEVEAVRKESKTHDEVSDNESEPDADAYSFTEDQKRAMMELMVQKQEDTDLLDEEPPEYDVKDRIQQLNAELANDPTPLEGDRELRVGFKSEIVDLVAPPPPDYSDDESQPNSARGEPQSASFAATRFDSDSSEQSNKNVEAESSNSEEKTKKQYVIERDGNFEVLSQNELTASERAMYVSSEDNKKTEKQSSNQKTQEVTGNKSNNNIQSSTLPIQPRPPARARPNTATTTGPRRNVRPTQSPRPKSAENASDSNTSLDNFNYHSPYAMTPEQKEQSKEMSKKTEEMRRNKERQHQREEEERRKENESAFQAWLEQKREERRKNSQHNEDKQQTEAERKEENEHAYKTWLKEKRTQGKKDKLLKRRQHQEQMEGYFIRPREECERAFKEWLKKKNSNLRKQHEMEKRQVHMYRVQVKRSKKANALVRALKESQAFRYVDYYGYRY